MRRLIQTHRAALEAFLNQRDFGVLVIRAAGEQIGYAIQVLRSIELDGSPHVFLAFAQDFASPGDFASLLAERVKATEIAIRDELGPAAESLPELPKTCLDTG